MYVCGLDHVDLGEQFFVLTDCPLMCEGRSSSYGRHTSQDHGDSGETRETCEEATLPCLNHGGFCFFISGSHQWVTLDIICDMYMDKVGIPMLIKMSKNKKWNQG